MAQKRNSAKQIFNKVKMATDTHFYEDGSIKTDPASFEIGEHSVLSSYESKKTQRGRVTTWDDGTTEFRPYREGTGPRTKNVFKTTLSRVNLSQKEFIVSIRIPRGLGEGVVTVFDDEQAKIQEFLQNVTITSNNNI